MKELLRAITQGVQEKELTPKQLETVQDLVRQKFVKNSHKYYRLSDKYVAGELDVVSNGVGYLSSFKMGASKDLLIESNDINGGSKGDLVIAKRLFKKRGRQKAKVVLVLQRAFSHVVVYTKLEQKRIVGINVKNGLSTTIAASQKSLKALPPKSVLKINNENGIIEEVLGVLDDPSVDEKISLAIYNKQEEFSKGALEEALSHGMSVDKALYPNYTDLTQLPFCTIDPHDAKDFDDAIFFDTKTHTLYVAIADVTAYVYPFGNIDKEARARGFSIYFPHKSIPMLPRNLSENICSLKPNEDRLAFCFKLTLEPSTCKVVKEELLRGVICSKRRFNYDEVDEFLEGKQEKVSSIDSLILEWLLPLKTCVDTIRKKRLTNAFEFRSDEVRMSVDEEQNLISTSIEKETPSHALIEDCMLLANKAAAKRIDFGVFRNHLPPSFERIEELLVDLEMIGLTFNFTPELPKLIHTIQTQANELKIRQDVDKLIIKSQKKAIYESESKGHFGLGFDTYTHFTSPIRRYSDLVLHRLLKAKIDSDEKLLKYQLQGIDELCENLSNLERESDRVAWDYMDRKFARWAYKRLGCEVEAIITDVGRVVIAKLDDEVKGARIFVVDDDVELLERVKLRLIDADIAQAKIFAKVTARLDP